MTHADFYNEFRQYLYIEDTDMTDVLMAVIISNLQKFGDPVWLTLIGASSGGKSQMIRPFGDANALIHQLDDITANSLIEKRIGYLGTAATTQDSPSSSTRSRSC